MARAKKVPCKGGGKIAFRAGPRTTTVKCHDCGDQQEVKKKQDRTAREFSSLKSTS
jgi:hypothetical protein